MRCDARPANLADLRKVLLQEVLEDIYRSLGECDSPQCGGNASAGENGMCADAPLTAAGRGHSYSEREGLTPSTVNRFALDRERAIWAGTTHGLFRFTNSRWEKIGKEWGFFAEQAG